ncbi:hypothetical protein H5410_056786 [Solanum commersonii]|uniref:Uncharacterized protein n=1 Tax=Solanum commersonii TaxID=4109 RepID=A0A9J5WNA0_SOLCO|nr:hypothetical protein H5410_056786 [Solanum commersonii]
MELQPLIESPSHQLNGPEVEAPSSYEEEVGANVHEVPEGGVGKDASAGIESMSNSGDVSTGAALLRLASSRVYSALIRLMFVEDERVTSISLVASRGTRTRRHNSVISTRNGRDV